jgi:hypothetical protein
MAPMMMIPEWNPKPQNNRSSFTHLGVSPTDSWVRKSKIPLPSDLFPKIDQPATFLTRMSPPSRAGSFLSGKPTKGGSVELFFDWSKIQI